MEPRLVAAAAAAALLLLFAAPALSEDEPPSWRPHMHAAERYAARRQGIIAFAIRTRDHVWSWRADRIFPSASLLKPMLLVAYLERRSVRTRRLDRDERATLGPMIRRSDNDDASRVLGVVGTGGLRQVARRAGMRRFTPVTPVGGLSRVDASDQTRFFLHIDRLMPARHRAFGMHLLASIVRQLARGAV